MNAPELKPCPFCGGKPQTFTKHGDERIGYVHAVKLYCSQCSAAVSREDTREENGWARKSDALKKATDAWNRRADLPPTDAEVLEHPTVKALVEALEKVKTDLQYLEQWVAIQEIDAALAAIKEATP